MSVRDDLGPGGALSRVLDAYESRPEQLEMAEAVDAAFAGGHPLLVEAGTGTGKSLAYLVGAVRSGLRVVISTATKALCEQIMQRDLPTLERIGLRADAVLVKGLSNYVCLRRLEDHRRAVSTGKARSDPSLGRVLEWVESSPTGDIADLDSVPEGAPVWRDVTSSSDTRVGQKCHFFDRCFVTRLRRRADAARIIVTNHHLFFADLALRNASGAQVLPDYDAVVFDEAHALEDTATDFFGVRLTRARVDVLVRDALRAFETAGLLQDPSRLLTVTRLVAAVSDGAARMFSLLPRPRGGPPGAGNPLALGASMGDAASGLTNGQSAGGGARTFVAREHLEGEMGDAIAAAMQALEDLASAAGEFVTTSDTMLSVTRRALAARDALATVTNLDAGSHVPYTDADARGGGAIAAAPIEIGPIFREKLWNRTGAIILTSATLSTSASDAGGFEFIRQRLGVPETASQLQLASPFDFGRQAALYVPRHLPEPRDPMFLEAAADEIRRLVDITGGGAFVLCTSVRAMRGLASALRDAWSHPTYVQGEAPKHALLERFRSDGDAVLFATSSFWEGVDVPGRALRLVIMDKLPFDSPDDPVTASRIQRLTEQGRSAFRDYQVPAAALALKQGFGRLIRTRRDAGVVVILDRRLLTRGYGKSLLASLPPASRCGSLEEVAAFWSSVDQRW